MKERKCRCGASGIVRRKRDAQYDIIIIMNLYTVLLDVSLEVQLKLCSSANLSYVEAQLGVKSPRRRREPEVQPAPRRPQRSPRQAQLATPGSLNA